MRDMQYGLVLSQPADSDLEAIFEYTQRAHGHTQALEYLGSFQTAFDALKANHYLGRKRSEIRSELRSLIHREHVIFYHIQPRGVRVVRVLHGRMDMFGHQLI